MKHSLWICLFVAWAGLPLRGANAFLAPDPPPCPASAQTSAPLTDRVVVIGASLSAGFGLCKELEVATPLSVLVDAALVDDGRAPSLNLGNNLTFWNPMYTGRYMMDRAVAAEPTLVIATDFLFWYGMSFRWWREEDRLKGLEEGLRQLERLSCPIVIGDFPDVRRALNGRHEITKRPVVFPSMIPEETTRAAMNQRVREWAAERDQVVLMPLDRFLAALGNGQPMPLPKGQSLQGSIEDILQVDLLHPKLDACLALVLNVMDGLVKADVGLAEDRVRWSLTELREQVMRSTAPERAASLASRARRAKLAGR